jgi:hypothetical protein
VSSPYLSEHQNPYITEPGDNWKKQELKGRGVKKKLPEGRSCPTPGSRRK